MRPYRHPRTLSFLRLLAELRRFAADRLTPDEARRILERRLPQRDEAFLVGVERQIYANHSSPYLPLLNRAGCELGDLKQLVHSHGLETALRQLFDAGVYVSFEEFKGRRPIVRGDLVLDVTSDDFDSPGLGGAVQSSSGGSSGRPVRFSFDLGNMRTFLPVNLLQFEALGLLGARSLSWWEDLPSPTGLKAALRAVAFGDPLQRWYSVPAGRRPLTAARSRLASSLIIAVSRSSGGRIPWPRPLPLDRAGEVARWAAEALASSDRCVVLTNVSRAVRVAQAARRNGIDLSGATFYGASDPPTEAKSNEISASGARHVPNYHISEAGCIGVGCARPASANDLHFCADMFAMHTVHEKIAQTAVTRLYFTALTGTSPKVMLNVDSDDYGHVEDRSCGCLLGESGLGLHIRDVFSVSKLTAEGVTLVGSEMIRVLEEVLPGRFGGSALDYQLLEEEDEEGLTRLDLVVSPRIELRDEGEVIDTVLAALGRSNMAADVRGLWRAARTIRIKRAEPVITERGKLLPLVSTKSARRGSST